MFDTDLGPIGISICYDFYQGPELSRILAMKGARLLVNPTGRSALPRACEHLEQVTLVRAHENLVAAASANRVGAQPRSAGVGRRQRDRGRRSSPASRSPSPGPAPTRN